MKLIQRNYGRSYGIQTWKSIGRIYVGVVPILEYCVTLDLFKLNRLNVRLAYLQKSETMKQDIKI